MSLVRVAVVIGALIMVPSGTGAGAQSHYQPTAANLAAREWFQDAKFGMFIHWGVYSLLGNGEWVMQQRKIPVADYEWLAATFNPTKFDAKVWVALAQRAGARYITITSRHHDGFSMFKTKQTRYNIVDWTPFGRDPLKELADACRETGIKLFFYYSQLDWHHADYWPRGLQPAALIIPNHHETPRPGEDAQTLLVGGTRVPFRQTATGLALTLPPRGADEIDQVVVLDLAR